MVFRVQRWVKGTARFYRRRGIYYRRPRRRRLVVAVRIKYGLLRLVGFPRIADRQRNDRTIYRRYALRNLNPRVTHVIICNGFLCCGFGRAARPGVGCGEIVNRRPVAYMVNRPPRGRVPAVHYLDALVREVFPCIILQIMIVRASLFPVAIRSGNGGSFTDSATTDLITARAVNDAAFCNCRRI